MNRIVAVLALLLVAALGAGQVFAAKPTSAPVVQLDIPAATDGQTTVAVTLSLPRGTAAVDGRLLLDKSAAEVVGLAPIGGGVALLPHEIDGGYAFGAYGLSSLRGKTALRIILAPLAPGALGMTVVVDAAADAAGRRITLTANGASGTLRVGKGGAKHAAPAKTSKPGPKKAAGPTRDLVADGALGKMDLDVVRAGWELARANEYACGEGDLSADANGDGCVDIVDLQAVVAAQGTIAPTGKKGHTSDNTSIRGASVNGIDTSVTASISGAPEAQPQSAAVAGLTFTVNSTADTPDANNGDGLCADANGACTLRAAITESNWQLGPNTINFNVPGSAPVPIQLTSSSLSLIQDRSGGTTIDGYTQPGSQPNTSAVGSNAVPGIILVGTADAPRGIGVRITSPGNVIRGLQFHSHYRGIFLDGADAHDNVIAGNILGFNAAGTLATYASYTNIHLNNGAHHNLVGGPALGDRNLSGRAQKAVYLYGPGTDHNAVQNNVLCIGPSGFTGARCLIGIDADFGPKHNLFGGSAASERNVVGPTARQAVEISHGWDPSGVDTSDKWQNNDNSIVGNWLGFRGDGSYDALFRSGQDNPGGGDNGNGVNIHDGSNNNLVEGNWVAAAYDGIQTMSPNSSGNIIRGNIIGESPLGEPAPIGRDGIVARINTRSVIIEGNIVRNAGRYGIALSQKDVLWVRVSQNVVTDMAGSALFFAVDPNDPTKGADELIAPPVITAATTTLVYGSGIPNATVELYRASRPAGETGLPVEYLGSTTVDGNGNWSIGSALQVGERATALQILPNNNTSRLSANVATTFEPPPSPPSANFEFAQQAGTTEVSFNDTSTGMPASWSWNFGDGITSSHQNPTHTYAVAGSYSVTLTVANAGGSNSVTRTVDVTISETSVVVVNDTFSRSVSNAWGSAEVGGSYTLVGNVGAFDVANGVGTMNLPQAGASRSALLDGISERDVDLRVRVAANKAASGGRAFVYLVARRSGNNEYRPRLMFNQDGTVSASASILVNGKESALGPAVVVPGFAPAPGSFVWLRAQVRGANPTTIRVKVWSDGETEPSSWNFTAANSHAAIQGPGASGLRTHIESGTTNAPVLMSFDQFSVTSSSGQATVVADAFGRSVNGGWGSADNGGPYSIIGNTANFSVANGAGTMNLPAAGAARGALLNAISQFSVETRVRIALDRIPTGNSLLVYSVVRRNSNSEYRPRVTFNPNGSVVVNASRLVNGSEAPLGSPVVVPGLFVTKDSYLWFKAEVSGANPTTIRVKVWVEGQAEPQAWQYSVTDNSAALQASGTVGLRAYLSSKATNAPIRVSFDDYSVKALP